MAKPEETSASAPQTAHTQTLAEPDNNQLVVKHSRALVTDQPTTNKTAQRTDHCKLGYGALRALIATDNQSCPAYKPEMQHISHLAKLQKREPLFAHCIGQCLEEL